MPTSCPYQILTINSAELAACFIYYYYFEFGVHPISDHLLGYPKSYLLNQSTADESKRCDVLIVVGFMDGFIVG